MSYFWKGIDIEGRECEGASALKNINDLSIFLKEQNIFRSKIYYIYPFQFKTPISQQLLVDFLFQLQKMLSSGITLLDSLSFIIKHQSNTCLAYVLCQMKEDLQQGHSLRHSFGKFDKYWSSLLLQLIDIAEQSDQLPKVLKELLTFFEKRLEVTKQRQKMLAYPMVVAGVSSIIFLGILLFIVPMFEEFFASFKSELPLSTQIVIAMSNSLRTKPLFWLLGGGFIILGVRSLHHYLGFYSFLRIIPFFAKMEQTIQILFYARSMSLTIQSGLNFGKSLELAESVVSKSYLSDIQRIHHKINYGEPLAKAYSSSKLFTPVFIHLIAMGESVGNLEHAFEHIIEMNQEWLERCINIMNSFIEPFSILIVACGILLALLSIYLPIFSVAEYF